jgi:hypothetical protein
MGGGGFSRFTPICGNIRENAAKGEKEAGKARKARAASTGAANDPGRGFQGARLRRRGRGAANDPGAGRFQASTRAASTIQARAASTIYQGEASRARPTIQGAGGFQGAASRTANQGGRDFQTRRNKRRNQNFLARCFRGIVKGEIGERRNLGEISGGL